MYTCLFLLFKTRFHMLEQLPSFLTFPFIYSDIHADLAPNMPLAAALAINHYTSSSSGWMLKINYTWIHVHTSLQHIRRYDIYKQLFYRSEFIITKMVLVIICNYRTCNIYVRIFFFLGVSFFYLSIYSVYLPVF